MRLLEESHDHRTSSSPGLIYVDAKRQDFVTQQNMPETPLALLADEQLRPSAGNAGKDHGDDLNRLE